MVERIVIRPDAIDRFAIEKAAAAIAGGGIVAYPTDTFYGLAVDPRSAEAVERLFAAKGRERGRPTPLIASTADQAAKCVDFNDVARGLVARFWPGPLSLVLPARGVLQRAALGHQHTAAIRVPAQPLAQALADAFGSCITATSANTSGQPPARSAQEIDAALLEHIDLVIDGGTTPGGAPSTIVDLTSDAPRLIRAGAIAWDRVLESLQ